MFLRCCSHEPVLQPDDGVAPKATVAVLQGSRGGSVLQVTLLMSAAFSTSGTESCRVSRSCFLDQRADVPSVVSRHQQVCDERHSR